MPPQGARLSSQQDQLKIISPIFGKKDISHLQYLDKETLRGNSSFWIQQGSNPDDEDIVWSQKHTK